MDTNLDNPQGKYWVVSKHALIDFYYFETAIRTIKGWDTAAVVWYDEDYDRWYIVNGVDCT